MPCREVIIVPDPVLHRFGGLGVLQIISHAKGSRTVLWNCNEPRKIDRARHTNESNVRGTTVCFITVPDRLEDGRAAWNRAILDFLPVGAMISGDRQVVKIVPGQVEEASPVEHEPVNNRAAV